MRTYTALTPHNLPFVPSVSYLVKAWSVLKIPLIGFVNSIQTIMMLKIWSELPDMYIMMAFMGSCLAGAKATSHAFLSLRVSVSSAEGRVRAGFLVAAVERWDRIRLC